MPNTNITALIVKLRTRLNDLDEGAYTDAEVTYCLNTAIQETELLLRSNVQRTEFKTADLTDIPADGDGLNVGSYYASDYAQVFDVWCNDAALQRLSDADLSKLGSYEGATPAIPTVYWMNGSDIYFWPLPIASYTFKISGLKISTAYSGTTDITTIPRGISEMLILDRAESEARRMRLMNSINPQLQQVLYDRWLSLLGMEKKQ